MAKNAKREAVQAKLEPNKTAKPCLADRLPKKQTYTEEYTLGETKYNVVFHTHIPAVMRSILLGKVEEIYFADGAYDPAYGDAVVRFLVATMYTEENFDEDLDIFERFADATGFEVCLPKEATDLIGSVRDKVEFLVQQRAHNSKRQDDMYAALAELCGKTKEVVGTLGSYVSNFEKQMAQESDVSMKDIVGALQLIGKKDEKKITAAILDYQAEKAKKRAVAKPEAE